MGGGSTLGSLYFGSLGRNELFEDKISLKEFQAFTLDSFPGFSRVFGCDRLTWQCDLEILGLLLQILIGLIKASLGSHLIILVFKLLASIFTRVLILELGGFGVADLET